MRNQTDAAGMCRNFSFVLPMEHSCDCFCGVEDFSMEVLDATIGDSFHGGCYAQVHLHVRFHLYLLSQSGRTTEKSCTRCLTLEVPRGMVRRCDLYNAAVNCELVSFRRHQDTDTISLQVRICLRQSTSTDADGCLTGTTYNTCDHTCAAATNTCAAQTGTCAAAQNTCGGTSSLWYLTDGTRYMDRVGSPSSCYATTRSRGWCT